MEHLVIAEYRYGRYWVTLSEIRNTAGESIMYVVNTSLTGKMSYTARDGGKEKASECFNIMRYNAYIVEHYCGVKRR